MKSSKVITCELVLPLFIALFSHSSNSYEIKSSEDALEYLSHFGYLREVKTHANVQIEDAKEALREFQDFTHLIPNGRLDPRTLKTMNKPRCGNKDLRVDEVDTLRRRRRKRVANNNPGVHQRWRKRVLTYRIMQPYSLSTLKPKHLQKEIDLAFKYWEREANLTFKKIWEGTPDIEISFYRGDHGDNSSFDGPSNTLAHAFYPVRGDIHFDDEEKWTANARSGHNLRIVAVHEIGHALGLDHSDEKKSVMYSMYQGFKDKLQLHVADISAIQELYGPKISKDSIPGKNDEVGLPSKMLKLEGMISNPESVDLCPYSRIDAISTLEDGHIYVFKGDYYFRLDMGQLIDYSKFPKRINETFRGLPSKLDTVLTNTKGKTYFFKGKSYWRSSGTKMDKGYPKKISANFLGIPNHLDGAFIWSWNNMTYFFKRNRYWRYNFDTPNKRAVAVTRKPKNVGVRSKKRETEFIPGYPKKINTNWPGIPDDIEDAFKAPNGRSYFFKGGEYWQFHDPDSHEEAAAYPRSSGEWWFGCTQNPETRKIRHLRKRKTLI